jgi:hypothetical protein
MPTETKPSRAPIKRLASHPSLPTITAISFSLTFVGMSVALLAGMLPPSFAGLAAPVDLGVLLLVVPLCALVLAMMAEVLRAAIRGLPRTRPVRNATTLSAWQPGQGEG